MKAFETVCPWLADPLETVESAARANRLGHAWLISGPPDIGKRDLAYVLASRLLHGKIGAAPPAPASPDEIVARYAWLDESDDWHPDLHRVRAEEDKLSIAVDQVREMTAALALTPHRAGLKVVVIESAERMTPAAANALLKSLEEPTKDTYLLLLAERPGRLLATIRSRCQQLSLRSPAAAVTLAWLSGTRLAADGLPPELVDRAPLAAARAVMDAEILKNYREINDSIKALYDGREDPHSMAERLSRGDTELALDCLVASLQGRIRRRFMTGRSTPVTEPRRQFDDNPSSTVSAETLFEGLQMAENLREQLGRGINVELALKALLLGLEPVEASRVKH